MPHIGWMDVSPSSLAGLRPEGLSRNIQRKSETLQKYGWFRKHASVTCDVGNACRCKKKSVEMLNMEMQSADALPVENV